MSDELGTRAICYAVVRGNEVHLVPDHGAPGVDEIVDVLREAQSKLPRSEKLNTRDRIEKLLAQLGRS